jgi:rhodanese-related sulfurtransferase
MESPLIAVAPVPLVVRLHGTCQEQVLMRETSGVKLRHRKAMTVKNLLWIFHLELIRKARHGDLDDLKRKKIVIYCRGGYKGNIAADELNKLGFDTVNIEGGYSAYKNYGNKNEGQ